MKKQIIYSKLIPRLFSTAVDLFLLYIPAFPILYFCSLNLMMLFYKNYFIEYNIEMYNYGQMFVSTIRPEFANYLQAGHMNRYILYNLSMLICDLLVIGSYFVGFWYYKGATPSKMFMRMKIVDAITFEKPTFKQLIKRFLGYVTFPFGIWFVIFSEKKQALHDTIAGTVVIKS